MRKCRQKCNIFCIKFVILFSETKFDAGLGWYNAIVLIYLVYLLCLCFTLLIVQKTICIKHFELLIIDEENESQRKKDSDLNKKKKKKDSVTVSSTQNAAFYHFQLFSNLLISWKCFPYILSSLSEWFGLVSGSKDSDFQTVRGLSALIKVTLFLILNILPKSNTLLCFNLGFFFLFYSPYHLNLIALIAFYQTPMQVRFLFFADSKVSQ